MFLSFFFLRLFCILQVLIVGPSWIVFFSFMVVDGWFIPEKCYLNIFKNLTYICFEIITNHLVWTQLRLYLFPFIMVRKFLNLILMVNQARWKSIIFFAIFNAQLLILMYKMMREETVAFGIKVLLNFRNWNLNMLIFF